MSLIIDGENPTNKTMIHFMINLNVSYGWMYVLLRWCQPTPLVPNNFALNAFTRSLYMTSLLEQSKH